MAYINQEEKKEIVARVKANVLSRKEFKNMRLSYAIRHYSSLVVTIKSGDLQFQNQNVNVRGNRNGALAETGTVAEQFVIALSNEINKTNHDNSDIMTDYFDVGFYVDIQLGKHDKPYKLTV